MFANLFGRRQREGVTRTTGLVLDRVFMQHETHAGHPDTPQKIPAIDQAIRSAGLDRLCVPVKPREIALQSILAVHEEAYVTRLREACAQGLRFIDCEDSSICPASFKIAQLAAGSVVAAVDAVMERRIKNAFCVVRPPGHHAERDRSMGFCLLNNVAIAAQHLLDNHGLRRIAIVDFDVHHGNGTQHIFEADSRVLFCDIHASPEYPGTGSADETGIGAGSGYTLNVPLPLQSGINEYRVAFAQVFAKIRDFAPEFILVSAGFDAHKDDLLGKMRLESKHYGEFSRELKALAQQQCEGRLVSVLEGGYNLKALGESVAAYVREQL